MSFVILTTTLRDVVPSPNLPSCQSLHSAVVKGGWSTCNSPPGSHAGGTGGLPVSLMRVFPGKHRQPLSFTFEALCAIKEKTSGSLQSKQQRPPSKHLPCLFKIHISDLTPFPVVERPNQSARPVGFTEPSGSQSSCTAAEFGLFLNITSCLED